MVFTVQCTQPRHVTASLCCKDFDQFTPCYGAPASHAFLCLPNPACPAAEFEYALRSMFSNTPSSSRRAADGSGSAGDGAAADEAGGRVVKVIADKRALQVEVCIKRLRMAAPELAAALNRIDTDKLKVSEKE